MLQSGAITRQMDHPGGVRNFVYGRGKSVFEGITHGTTERSDYLGFVIGTVVRGRPRAAAGDNEKLRRRSLSFWGRHMRLHFSGSFSSSQRRPFMFPHPKRFDRRSPNVLEGFAELPPAPRLVDGDHTSVKGYGLRPTASCRRRAQRYEASSSRSEPVGRRREFSKPIVHQAC